MTQLRGATAMKSRAFCITLLSIFAVSIAASLPAQAQRARVFVSVTGNDENPCTAGSPCKTFQAAHDAVLAGGEISVLDTGGYGTLVINKAVSIVAVGVEASIAIPSGVNGITINAGSSDKVSLRGLTLDGTGVGNHGIVFESGFSLTVENCVVRNMVDNGLLYLSTVTSLQTLAVSNSYFDGNGVDGILIKLSNTGAITAAIDRTGMNGNTGDGLQIQAVSGSNGNLTVAMTDSVAANNGFAGVLLDNTGALGVINTSLTHSLVSGNGVGLEGEGTGAALWLAQSTLTGNATGFNFFTNSVTNTFGDNYFADNGKSTGLFITVGKQ